MAKTFKDRREAKQQAGFIGRSEHLDLFRNNLKSDDPIQIFNIFGQGGVGKSYLSQQYKGIAESNNCIAAYSDESIKSVLQWMESVSEQFRGKGRQLTEFDKRYKVYIQELYKLEADPNRPKGALGGTIKKLAKGMIREGKTTLPGGELIATFFDEESVSSSVGEWAEFVRKKITNKDEAELILEPLKVLTPIFLKDILKFADSFKFVCFFIDTFEETDRILEKWLLEILDNTYGDVPGNILLVIAGRDELNSNLWLPLVDFTQKIPLEPFSEIEANHYLFSHGIEDNAIKSDILSLSGRLPVLMAWLVSAASGSKENLSNISETAVERFLKWVNDDQKREMALIAALPRLIDQDILECFLSDKSQCKPLFEWLIKQPFVLRRGDHWAFHNVVRDQMLRYIRTRSQKTWESRHKAIAEYYTSLQEGLELNDDEKINHPKWLDYEQEYLYHVLCQKPDKTIPLVIHAFVRNWYEEGRKASLRFGELMQIAGQDNDHNAIKGWGLRIITALVDYEKEEVVSIQMLIEDINAKKIINDNYLNAFLFFILGYAYGNLGDKDKAIECYEKAIEIKPDFHEAFNNMGSAYSANGDKDKAIECYEKAIEIKPDKHEAFYNMGSAYSANGDKGKAIECYEKAIEIKPDFHEAFNNMGSAYDDLGDKDKAIECYEKVIEIKPDKHEAFYNMGLAYSAKGDKDKAIECYEKAIEIKPDFHETFYNMGGAYDDLGDKDKAIECYEKAIEIKPDFHEAFNNMGSAYSANGDKDKAIECYEKAIEIKPDKHEAFNNMGLAYSAKGDKDKAIECYEKAIEIKPDFHEAFNNMGSAYSANGDKDKAIECYEKAIEIKPDKHEAFNNMGLAYSANGDKDKAIECYEKAIEIKPDFHQAFYNMGLVYSAKGDKDKAIECYEKAIEIKPDDEDKYYVMGLAYSAKGDKDKAIECYEKAIEIKPDFHEAFNNMGSAYDDLGDKEKAIECYEKAIEIKPDFHEAFYNMGSAYDDLGDKDKAIECYEKAIEIKPDDADTWMSLGWLFLKSGNLQRSHETLFKSVELGIIDFGNMNLGHVYLCQSEISKALEYYQISKNNFSSEEAFWEGMEDDFQYLEQYEVTKEVYQDILKQIREL